MAGGVRILGGELRGRRLSVPSGVRPSEGRLREALFSIWGSSLPDCRWLDLFAGSGAVGLEAVSRGARWASLVEGSAKVAGELVERCRRLAPDRTEVVYRRLPKGLKRPLADPFDLAFADPPYDFSAYDELLAGLDGWLAAAGEIAVEHSRRQQPIAQHRAWQLYDKRTYGDSELSFFRRVTSAEVIC